MQRASSRVVKQLQAIPRPASECAATLTSCMRQPGHQLNPLFEAKLGNIEGHVAMAR